jgi:tRNA uridine 5-carboxymethylaminomethyl modification enzyme
MIDDLVTRGVSEPYRMFTSRAEYRLRLRADNADQRLTPLGLEVDCVGPARRVAYEAKAQSLIAAGVMLRALSLTPSEAGRHGLDVNRDGRRRSAFDLLALPGVDIGRLAGIWPEIGALSPAIAEQVAVDARYAAYVERQELDVAALRRDEALSIPAGFDFGALPGLSTEVRQKLDQHRPATLAQAARIDGITPAALLILLAQLKSAPARKSA